MGKLFANGSSNEQAGAELMLISPNEHKIHCALCFEFKASNNETKYEALLVGLRLAREMKVDFITIYNDSQLVVR